MTPIKENFAILYYTNNVLNIYSEKTGVQLFLKKRTGIKYLYSRQQDLLTILSNLEKNKIKYTAYTRDSLVYRLVINNKYKIRNLSLYLHTTNNFKENYDLLLKLIKITNKLNINLNSLRTFSISSLAFYIFKNKFYNETQEKFKVLLRLFPKEDTFIRKSFFGGRADEYITKTVSSKTIAAFVNHKKNYYFYDVNSFYAYLMSNFDMPVGRPQKLLFLESTDFTMSENVFGFLEITFEVNNCSFPVLPYRDYEKKKISYPNKGKYKGVYFSEEIKLAIAEGYTIIYHSAYLFEKRIIFKDYVDYFYDLKINNEDHDIKSIAKNCLNTLYGSFSLNPLNPLVKVIALGNFTGELPKDLRYLSEDQIQLTIKSNARNVSLSSAISSYGRILMYNYIKKFQPVYFDTDSLLCCHPLPSELISKKIGFFKTVYKKKIIDFLFVQIKFYALLFQDNTQKLVIRGYNENQFIWNFTELKKTVLAARAQNKNITMLLKTGKTLTFILD